MKCYRIDTHIFSYSLTLPHYIALTSFPHTWPFTHISICSCASPFLQPSSFPSHFLFNFRFTILLYFLNPSHSLIPYSLPNFFLSFPIHRPFPNLLTMPLFPVPSLLPASPSFPNTSPFTHIPSNLPHSLTVPHSLTPNQPRSHSTHFLAVFMTRRFST